MSVLAAYQRSLLDLVKERWAPVPGDDAYLDAVAASPGLAMVREVAAWWRGFAVERTCVLTVRLLKARGEFEPAVAAFTRDAAFSNYGDAAGMQFLEYVAASGAGLVSDVAAFEAAYLRMRSGAGIDVTFRWGVDPTAVLVALSETRPLPDPLPQGSYRLRVADSLSGGFTIAADP